MRKSLMYIVICVIALLTIRGVRKFSGRAITESVTQNITDSVTSSLVNKAQGAVSGVVAHTTKTIQTYMPKGASQDVVTEVLQAHAALYQSSLGGVGGKSSSIASYIATAGSVLSVDIVDYLEQASNKNAALETLLAQLQHYRDSGETHMSTLKDRVDSSSQEYAQCTSDKKIADEAFYRSLRDGDHILLEQSIRDAQKAAACQASARVENNAAKAMLQRIQLTYKNMGDVIVLLQQNKDLIVNHFPLFKSNNLEKLVSVRNALRKQQFLAD